MIIQFYMSFSCIQIGENNISHLNIYIEALQYLNIFSSKTENLNSLEFHLKKKITKKINGLISQYRNGRKKFQKGS